MSDPEIQDYSHTAHIYTNAPTETTQVQPAEGTKTVDTSGVSDIEKSKSVAIEAPLSSGQPQLIAYVGDGTINSISLGLQKVTSDMLDSWNKSIKEQEELVRDLINSPLYRQMMEVRETGNDGSVTSVSKQEHPAIVNITDRLNDYLNRVGQDGSGPVNIATAPTISALIAFGSVLVVTANPTAFVPGAANSPLEAISQASSFMQTIVPENTALSATLLDINLLVMPPLYQISFNAAVDKTKKAPSELTFATKFAQEIIKMTTTPNLIQLKVIDQMYGADKLNAEQKEQLAAVIKLMMSLTAFALLYKAKTGGFTSNEIIDRVMGMINGKTPLEQGESGTLVKIIQAQLQMMDPPTKEKALMAIMEYLDSPDVPKSLDKMLDPLKTFEKLFQSLEPSADKTPA